MELLSFGNCKKPASRIIRGAEGHWIFDDKGMKYFDSMSGLWSVPLGYSQHEIKEAMTEQLARLPFFPNFYQSQNEAAKNLAHTLSDSLGGDYQVYFSNSGSMANETAFKLAIESDLNHFHEKKILCFSQSYHGSSYVTSALSDQPTKKFGRLFELNQVESIDVFDEDGQFNIDLMFKVIEQNAGEIGAVIMEPTVAAGGVFEIPMEDLETIVEYLRHLGIVSIFDEVVTGFGKRADICLSEKLKNKPDIVTLGKAMTNGYFPLAATLVHKRLLKTIKWFNHGFTFSGHPVGAQACLVMIEQLKKTRSQRKEQQQELRQACQLFQHAKLSQTRQSGLMLGFDLVDSVRSRDLLEVAWNNGILLAQASQRPQGVCACLPALIGSEEIEFFFKALKMSLDEVVCAAN